MLPVITVIRLNFKGDYIKLIYLRSRYYSPETGRFLTRYIWQGDYNRPLSLNRWNYTYSNPVNFIDPSGFCTPQTCYVFCFTGGGNTGNDLNNNGDYDLGNLDPTDTSWQILLKSIGQKAHVSVVPLFPYGPNGSIDTSLISRFLKQVCSRQTIVLLPVRQMKLAVIKNVIQENWNKLY
jgi:RHS repeat-associated protein